MGEVMTALAEDAAQRLVRIKDNARVALYRYSRGRLLHTSRGIPILLLTTIGRRTGQPRTHPVGFCRVGGNRLIIAGTNRGIDHPPTWVANLRAEPWARIELGVVITDVLVRSVMSDQRDRLWRNMCERYPEYSKCSARSGRAFPVFLLEPIN